MTVKKTKARYFAFIIYPESIPTNWEECLEKLGVPMAVSPLHDRDETERKFENLSEEEKNIIQSGGKVYKKAHYHVLYIARNPVTVESVRNKIKRALGNKSVSHIEIVDSVEHYYKYLTHESNDAVRKKKQRYSKDDLVFINDFDIDRYVTLDESQKRELKSLLLDIVREKHLVNVIDLLGYLSMHAGEHGIESMADVNDIVSTNPGAFRLWFEGNYQCGYRARYARTIDNETGEIKDLNTKDMRGCDINGVNDV